MVSRVGDELGAHVSASGGVQFAPERASAIDVNNIQLFTKQPSRWAEPKIERESAETFRAAREEYGIRIAGAHDSYLINLSTPDKRLWRMSQRCFQGELERCCLLGLDFMVTHPGNATDGNEAAGLERNARGVAESLQAVQGGTRVLLELTAGSGTSVGATFENLQSIIEQIPEDHQHRLGICFDTCHAYSAGYDLLNDYDSVWVRFDEVIGLERLGLIHMNDSKHPFDSRKDRHENIGQGTLGREPIQQIMLAERLGHVPKMLETPKGDEGNTADIANLDLLRSFRTLA